MEYQAVEEAILHRGVEWDIDPTLDRINILMDLLGQPQRAYPVVHITGTNGKTSTARMIDTLLRERNLRVGRFTSPHLTSIRERITLDGEPLSEERFVEVYEDVRPYLELVDQQQGRLSFFETLTAMAYAAFADAPVDVAVIEVGMGGTWDSTSVAQGAVAVVTPVSLDHVDYLGSDVEAIAREKAGIIKPGSMAILAQQSVSVAEILMRRAAETGSTVAREGLEFGVAGRELAMGGQMLRLQGLKSVYEDVFLPLYGQHQASNAACALAAVEAFTGGGDPLDADLVRAAFAAVASPGRLEVVRRSPTVLVDAAHNPGAMMSLVEAVEESFGFNRVVAVVAMAADKDVAGVLELLEPIAEEIVVTRNSSPRSMSPDELGALAEDIFGSERVHQAPRVDDAIDLAIGLAEAAGEFSGTGVLITGSVVTAGDARTLLKADRR
ncbi:bifunctional folylpolyglutamate synthase/dihydrofolate synthase [Sphaerisporangium sp. TRM90804]|uniref:bifunctional folylpolyglutamate synthase/dihydrofolate synthase n=1 Tax=Sphaerisporangium sp. TRM90804 TaxID=3031113 RepID=UPI00244A1E99|nr:bifunctional folylpolyglutamate synthase/dihydrofolate synthase [Sphaerisporangium sp. TRM90804]MDH2428116.1 bifunctional folylpolyglutamate synthase/dihydrofolate synthase [Sphaerisporangium sp. TRM90804]